jgi:hypothetical protein
MIIVIIAIILISAIIVYSLNDKIKIQLKDIESLNNKNDDLKNKNNDLKNNLNFKFELTEKKYESGKLSLITKNEISICNDSSFKEDKVKVEKYEYDLKGELSKIEYFEDNIDISYETESDLATQITSYDLIERILSENVIKTTSFSKFENPLELIEQTWTPTLYTLEPIEQTIKYPIDSENKSTLIYHELSVNLSGNRVIDRTTIFRYTHDEAGNKIKCFEEGEKDSVLTIFKYDANQNLIEENLYRSPTEDNHLNITIANENLFRKCKFIYNQNGVIEEKNIIYLNPDLGTVKYNYINGKNNNSILESVKEMFLKQGPELSKNDLENLKMIDIINKINPIHIVIYKNELKVMIEKIS